MAVASWNGYPRTPDLTMDLPIFIQRRYDIMREEEFSITERCALMKFGDKDHLERLRQGEMQWTWPEAHGDAEPQRPKEIQKVVFLPEKVEYDVERTGSIFCMAGIHPSAMDTANRSESLRSLTARMQDRKQLWCLLVTDTPKFIDKVVGAIVKAPSRLHRTGCTVVASWTTAPRTFEIGFIRYVDEPTAAFEKKRDFQDEREVRFLACPRLNFVWDGNELNWYRVHLGDISSITFGPFPTCQLTDCDWWKNIKLDINFQLGFPAEPSAPISNTKLVQAYLRLPSEANQQIDSTN